MTVERLGREMSSAELSEWLAFNRIEPLPDPYWCSAQQSYVAATLWGGGRRHKFEDFLPLTPGRKRRMTPEQMLAKVRASAKIRPRRPEAPDEADREERVPGPRRPRPSGVRRRRG